MMRAEREVKWELCAGPSKLQQPGCEQDGTHPEPAFASRGLARLPQPIFKSRNFLRWSLDFPSLTTKIVGLEVSNVHPG